MPKNKRTKRNKGINSNNSSLYVRRLLENGEEILVTQLSKAPALGKLITAKVETKNSMIRAYEHQDNVEQLLKRIEQADEEDKNSLFQQYIEMANNFRSRFKAGKIRVIAYSKPENSKKYRVLCEQV